MDEKALKQETQRIYIEYRIRMDKLISQAFDDIRAGKIRIENIEDFERMVKLDLMLLGEPTERGEVIHKNSPPDITELLSKLEAYVAE